MPDHSENMNEFPVQPENTAKVPDAFDLQIEAWFTYHPPTDDQPQRYEHLRIGAKQFAKLIANVCPPCADRTAAIQKVREAVMTANASIACGGI